ncbi:penicillin-binding protein activator [Shewanella sp. AS16]|uniref:penicillin-binding protein activator n=1 Tax=Shewanella sp. AS16 TaxID=2907625 RepID=UPI001F1A2831|nr:penicillin-binding protein activator [Shewanella sp. AS16]MCE9686033.1 penicillin-binding protein activator [Shewanella sp. AS16]
MLKSLNTTKFISVAILSVVLFGCGTRTQVPTAPKAVSLASAPQQPSHYLAEAARTQEAESKARYLLLAAHAYINGGNYAAAQQLLEAMKTRQMQSQSLLAEHAYLTARVLEQTATAGAALAILDYPDGWSLPNWQRAAYHQFKARLYQQDKQPIEQVRELTRLSRYLPAQQQAEVNDKLWQALQPLQEQVLERVARDDKDPDFSGWLQLAYIVKHFAVEPSQLVGSLGEWQQRHPGHPAAMKLPSDLDRALNTKPFHPGNVAVLLPLSGARANIAYAIRQGILSSYLAEADSDMAINFFDTAEGAAQAYQAAVAGGAEFIIGPLLQTEIDELHGLAAQDSPKVPQLFLNQTDKFTPSPEQFYFALSPAQEAMDAAEKLYQDGITTPLLLASNDAIGQRMAQSFGQTWQRLTGKQAEVHFYDAGDQMKLTVREALGVKDSQARIARIKALIGNKTEADFRSRRDIDAIYMLSSAQDLALLKPFIDVNFSVFAEPVPLYTSSRSRQDIDTRQAQELNNLVVSDIPWLLANSDERQRVAALWPGWNNSQKRLYSMGYDALQLVGRLAQMRAFPGYQFSGRSGNLSVADDGIIQRRLSWARYLRGHLRPL